METLRKFYRNPFIETGIIAAVVVQMISGLTLARKKRKFTERICETQVWTGCTLLFSCSFMYRAVMAGRHLLYVDTNFYFAAAGLNSFPLTLFFVPYYGLSVISLFGHIAAIHSQNMRHSLTGINATPAG